MISGDECAERLGVNLRVHVRDQFEYDVIDARQAGGRAVNETRQFAAVSARQVPARHLDLFLDKIKIIEQPLGGGSDAAARLHRECGAVETSQDRLVLPEPGQQAVGAAGGDDGMRGGERLGMPRQLVEPEKFSP